jgi:hypothetical protein
MKDVDEKSSSLLKIISPVFPGANTVIVEIVPVESIVAVTESPTKFNLDTLLIPAIRATPSSNIVRPFK